MILGTCYRLHINADQQVSKMRSLLKSGNRQKPAVRASGIADWIKQSCEVGEAVSVAAEGTSPCCKDVILLTMPVDNGCSGCSLCNEEFDRAVNLSRHAQERHLTSVMFICLKCGRRGSK
ncbi:hypothetical protein AVEN_234238-1 [Araneus ventricosus]|uniref:C2H2-type domain-containing protein n=1 Tax=Araneus ventricosus TaxID=182803 RepID=A0A4Y2A8K9_ARAVE|nr:hypothetical protein AVEN_234238-1 [Araneus ventricosus]